MKFILGKKIEMSQLFAENGDVIPVTLVHAGPCGITQVKKEDKDGYASVQIGFDKKKKLSKALRGHLKGLDDYRWLREFRITENTENKKTQKAQLGLKRGDIINIIDTFKVGDKIKIIGTSKGKGFQGVVKRHGFHGSPATHGHKDQLRMPGSIGAGGVQRVIKGLRMAGHMGAERVTVKNLEIAKIDLEKNILYIKGAVPGRRGSLVMISGEGELKITENTKNKKSQKTQEENKDIKGNKEIKEKENVGTDRDLSVEKEKPAHEISQVEEKKYEK